MKTVGNSRLDQLRGRAELAEKIDAIGFNAVFEFRKTTFSILCRKLRSENVWIVEMINNEFEIEYTSMSGNKLDDFLSFCITEVHNKMFPDEEL